jgi:hypothetical protein
MQTPEDRLLRWAPEIGAIKLGVSETLIALSEETTVDNRLIQAAGDALGYLAYAEEALRSITEET